MITPNEAAEYVELGLCPNGCGPLTNKEECSACGFPAVAAAAPDPGVPKNSHQQQG